MHRLCLLLVFSIVSAWAASPPPAREVAVGPAKNEAYSLVVAPWTQENQRHDHAQIFPLRDGRLLLVWCEYYVRSPSRIFRTPYSHDGNTNQVPCQITGKISRDGGRTWSGRITLQENIGADNVKQPNLVRCANSVI